MRRQIIFQSIRKWITFKIQQNLLLPESCAKEVSRGILQRPLLQKYQSVICSWAVGEQKTPRAIPLCPGLGAGGGVEEKGGGRGEAGHCSLAFWPWNTGCGCKP